MFIPFVRVADRGRIRRSRRAARLAILLVLILAILFGGLGSALHALWWVAAIVLIAWLVGFAVRVGEGRRWYYW